MKIFAYWKIILGLVLVFGAGAVTGGVATQHLIKRALERSLKFENWTAHASTFMEKKLHLTPEQRRSVEGIYERKGPEFKAVFARTLDDSGRIIIRMEHEVDRELNPEQRAIHDRLKQGFRADLKSKFNFDLPLE